jgi:ssDNA-binding replication factor A large subunit
MENYAKLVERISQHAGMSPEEIERKVEAKRAKLSGLVSKEGAAQIVAAELGINFENELLKVSELADGMKRANTIVQVLDVYPVRSYSKNGREGKVANLFVADESGNTRLVLWDINHINLIEQGKVVKGDTLEIANANIRNGEIHLSSFSDMKKSKSVLTGVVSQKQFTEKKLKDAKVGERFSLRAVIVQVFEPRYFEVCPECGKKVVDSKCGVHGTVISKRRALLNAVLDDGTETTRALIVGENIEKLGLTNEEVMTIELFDQKKLSLLGEEKRFFGTMRSNQLYNTIEFSVENIENVNADELIKELEQTVR